MYDFDLQNHTIMVCAYGSILRHFMYLIDLSLSSVEVYFRFTLSVIQNLVARVTFWR